MVGVALPHLSLPRARVPASVRGQVNREREAEARVIMLPCSLTGAEGESGGRAAA